MEIKLGERIRLVRKKAGVTQKQLAENLKIAFSTLNMYEKGHRIPDAEILRQIAIITKGEPAWLLTGEERQAVNAEGISPFQTPEEREYLEKLLEVLRNPNTKKAIQENIDTFLKVPRPDGAPLPVKKKGGMAS